MLKQLFQFDEIPHPIVVMKHSGEAVYVNQSAIEFCAIQKIDLLTMQVHDAFHPKTILPADCLLCKAIRDEKGPAAQRLYYDDRKAWYKISYSPVHIDAENDGILQMLVNVTDEVSVKKKKFDNELSIHALLTNMPVIYYRIDENETILEMVGAALSRLEMYGENHFAMKAKDVFSTLAGKYEAIVRHGRYFFESHHETAKGDVWFFHYVFTGPEVGEITGFALDVTTMKKAQRATLQLSVDKRKLARKMLQMQEDVRFEVARELHDEFGQTITAIRLIASSMLNVQDVTDDFFQNNVKSISDIANRMYDSAHELMYKLRPLVLDNLGLEEALLSCIDGSGLRQTGVDVQLSVVGDIESMDMLVQLTLFRIVQEALTNAAKYAKASHIQIRLERKKSFYESISQVDILELRISDDGIGIGASDKKPGNKPGMGLRGLQERVQALGGVLNISSDIDKGAVLFVRINLKTERINKSE